VTGVGAAAGQCSQKSAYWQAPWPSARRQHPPASPALIAEGLRAYSKHAALACRDHPAGRVPRWLHRKAAHRPTCQPGCRHREAETELAALIDRGQVRQLGAADPGQYSRPADSIWCPLPRSTRVAAVRARRSLYPSNRQVRIWLDLAGYAIQPVIVPVSIQVSQPWSEWLQRGCEQCSGTCPNRIIEPCTAGRLECPPSTRRRIRRGCSEQHYLAIRVAAQDVKRFRARPEEVAMATPGDALMCVADLAELPVTKVRIESLRASDSPRLAGEDVEHLQMLAAMEGPLPPIIVHRPSMRVIDGMHRLRAARIRGDESVDARFVDGDDANCFVLGVEVNVRHGLPLSLADRKAAAARILGFFPEWSDRRVASVAGVAARTVAALRQSQTDGARLAGGVRVGLDGRTRPVDAAERRARAGKALVDNPGASLRQVARDAGVSPETVRHLRAQLREGNNSPEARRQRPGFGAGRQARRGAPSCSRAAGRDGLSAMSVLMADPAVRSSEIGRALLRMLNTSAAIARYGRQICDSLPTHCMPAVEQAARSCGQFWQDFADQVQQSRRIAMSNLAQEASSAAGPASAALDTGYFGGLSAPRCVLPNASCTGEPP
jgi:ParB-like chromosome segregation protein Spo0J